MDFLTNASAMTFLPPVCYSAKSIKIWNSVADDYTYIQ